MTKNISPHASRKWVGKIFKNLKFKMTAKMWSKNQISIDLPHMYV